MMTFLLSLFLMIALAVSYECPQNPHNFLPPSVSLDSVLKEKGIGSYKYLRYQSQLAIIFGDSPMLAKLTCEAPYPVELVYDEPPLKENWDLSNSLEEEIRSQTFQDFYNKSSYNFAIIRHLMIPAGRLSTPIPFLYRCEAVGNPCLHQTIEIIRYNRKGVDPQTILSATTFKGMFPPDESRLPIEPTPRDECDILFYYERKMTKVEKKTKENETLQPAYAVRCVNALKPNSSTNMVDTRDCTGPGRLCTNVLRSHRLSKKCWKKEPLLPHASGDWRRGQKVVKPGRPILVTCTTMTYPGYKQDQFASLVHVRTTQPKGGAEETEDSDINFEYKDVPPSAQIIMETFNETQIMGTNLIVTCLLDHSMENVRVIERCAIGLSFKNSADITVLSDWPGVVSESREVYTGVILLDNLNLTRIYCFGVVGGTWDWVNTSMPIRVLDPAAPLVTKSGDRRETGTKVQFS